LIFDSNTGFIGIADAKGHIHGLKGEGTNHGELEQRNAEGVGCEEGVSPTHGGVFPSPSREGSGKTAMPPPQRFFRFLSSKWATFWCILGANFVAVELSVLHA